MKKIVRYITPFAVCFVLGLFLYIYDLRLYFAFFVSVALYTLYYTVKWLRE